MKWSKRNEHGAGYLGEGYQSGEYVIQETSHITGITSKRSEAWTLTKNGDIIKQDSTAKALKVFAETL